MTSYVGRAIRAMRSDMQMSQAEVAERCGISMARISEIETGAVSSPQAKTINAIAVGLGIPAEQIYQTAVSFQQKATQSAQTAKGAPEAPKSDGFVRDNFLLSVRWSKLGPEIHGGNLSIKPEEAARLLERWRAWMPKFRVQEAPHANAEERALLLAVLGACSDVYGAVPDEAEMKSGATILGRKLNLFFVFVHETIRKCAKFHMSFEELMDVMASIEEIEIDPDQPTIDPNSLIRILLRAYVKRTCDVDLDEVETIENLMREMNMDWVSQVETVYDTNERKVNEIFHALNSGISDMSREKIVDHIVSFLIDTQVGLDIIKFKELYVKH